MPSFLARENANRVPFAALWLSNGVVQIFLIVSWFAEYAFNLALKMTGSMVLVPYLLVAAYAMKLAWSGETYAADRRDRRIDGTRAAIATLYAAAMLYAGGAKFLLLSALLYAPGTWLYFHARREQRQRVFSLAEMTVFTVVAIAAIVALAALASGSIHHLGMTKRPRLAAHAPACCATAKAGGVAAQRPVCTRAMEGMPVMQWTYPARKVRIEGAVPPR